MQVKARTLFTADFETTSYEGQESTEVWSVAINQIGREEVFVGHRIEDFFNYFRKLPGHHLVYFHNLKFDGKFIIHYLKTHGYKEACYISRVNDEEGDDRVSYFKWQKENEMAVNSFQYSISEKGLWYTMKIKLTGKTTIEIRDSLKLLPFTLEAVGEAFDTPHKKLTMEYEGKRFAGCEISDEELSYIKNDVLCLSEAIQHMIDMGQDRLTIGACCMFDYKERFKEENQTMDWDEFFPNQYTRKIDDEDFTQFASEKNLEPTYGNYVLGTYFGGWCYLAPGFKGKVLKGGYTVDYNSLYPSMMHSSSGFKYPVGNGKYFKGKPDEKFMTHDNYYVFLRIKCRFKLKKGKLPFMHIRKNTLYNPHENLETSDVFNKKTGKHERFYLGIDGKVHDSCQILSLTMWDFKLLQEHYNLYDLEYLDYVVYFAVSGIFDGYINYWYNLKATAPNKVIRTLCKLFLNNLYGKFATTVDSSFKLAYYNEEKQIIQYEPVHEEEKTPGYIPIGSAITSHARYTTITAAQANYKGKGCKKGFVYADTDSLHIWGDIKDLKGVTVHDSNLGCVKVENEWDFAIFTRQKMYLEHDKTDRSYTEGKTNKFGKEFVIKCAGMNNKCKKNFLDNCLGRIPEKYPEREKPFWAKKLDFKDFVVGLEVPGHLTSKTMPGGCVLIPDYFIVKEL